MSTGYRKRVGVELASIATKVKAQNKLDLKAMARAARMSEGEALDRLIEGAIRRRQRKLEKHLDKKHLDAVVSASTAARAVT